MSAEGRITDVDFKRKAITITFDAHVTIVGPPRKRRFGRALARARRRLGKHTTVWSDRLHKRRGDNRRWWQKFKITGE